MNKSMFACWRSFQEKKEKRTLIFSSKSHNLTKKSNYVLKLIISDWNFFLEEWLIKSKILT